MVRKVKQRKQNIKPQHKSKPYSRKPKTIQARRKPRLRPSYHNYYYCPKCFFIYNVDPLSPETMINGKNNNPDNEQKAKSQRKKPVYKKPAKRRKSLKWGKTVRNCQSSMQCIYFG